MPELNVDSFFGETRVEKTAVIPKEAKTVANEATDESVCEVRFCTGGRLSAPPILHFRDYNMKASQAIAELPESSEHVPLIIDILNSMVVEDFDCGLLHLEEAKEVLLNVHAKWWGSMLTGFRYLIDEDIEDRDKLLAKENITTAEIPIGNIQVIPLDPEVKEPINITANGVTVHFIFPRMQNTVVVKNLLKQKFAIQDQEFHKIQQLVNYNKKQTDPDRIKDIPLADLEAYKNYLAEKAKYDLLYTRAQLICGVDGNMLETFEERVKMLEETSLVSVKHWMTFNKFLEGKGNFGVQDSVEFYSDVLEKKITRTFPFRTYALLPAVQMETDRIESAEVSFG